MQDPNALFTAAVQFLLVLLAISAHETAHAWVADLSGDPTPRALGRLTLNPLRHLDPFGSVVLPIMLLLVGAPVFGWGRRPPIVEKNLRRPRRDGALVDLAGPAANLALAAAATLALAVALQFLGPEAREAGVLTLFQRAREAAPLAGFPLVFTLVRMATINAFIAVFNLIPLPPLDAGQLALRFLPYEWAVRLAAFRPYGFMIGTALAVFGVVPALLFPFYGLLMVVIRFL
ncbi:MAG TPA: site-2 protease family protein [Thermoanaerobaculia bacterium]|nr:site-2 protease family protein [Thermoanaerobaculia bacterium]